MVTLKARARRVIPSVAIGLLLGWSISACGDDQSGEDPGTSAEEPVELTGNTFELVSVEGHELVPDTVIELAFEDDSMAVSAGCNTMSAAWSSEGDEVVWTGPVASTLMACPDELAAQDEWLHELFAEGMALVDGDAVLTLESGDVVIGFDVQ